jgi:hypothetical protein
MNDETDIDNNHKAKADDDEHETFALTFLSTSFPGPTQPAVLELGVGMTTAHAECFPVFSDSPLNAVLLICRQYTLFENLAGYNFEKCLL